MRFAARGARDMDDGAREVRDARMAEALRRQAGRVHLHALLLAVAATPLLFLL